MLLTLEETKNFLKVDYKEDDEYITELIEGAEGYLIDTIDNYSNKLNNSRFKIKAKLCVRVLISEMYTKRALTTDKVEKYVYCIQSLITQMRYCNYD